MRYLIMALNTVLVPLAPALGQTTLTSSLFSPPA